MMTENESLMLAKMTSEGYLGLPDAKLGVRMVFLLNGEELSFVVCQQEELIEDYLNGGEALILLIMKAVAWECERKFGPGTLIRLDNKRMTWEKTA